MTKIKLNTASFKSLKVTSGSNTDLRLELGSVITTTLEIEAELIILLEEVD